MLTIQTFRKSLVAGPGRRGPYLKSLSALTKLTPSQIHTLTSEMIWLDWF